MINLMQLKSRIDLFAMARQMSIRDGRYTDAMTSHFLFYMHMDEYLQIKKNLSNKDMMAVIKAMICIDYK
jgi:hypothetical protein